jgi:hypothetical protein
MIPAGRQYAESNDEYGAYEIRCLSPLPLARPLNLDALAVSAASLMK